MGTLNPKSNRVLELYHAFLSGEIVNKHDMATFYQVNERSIQRDIDTIRAFLAEQLLENGTSQTIEYDRKKNGYFLVSQQLDSLSKGELLSICKILISSRAYRKKDLESLINKLLNYNISRNGKLEIQHFISNDLFNYMEPNHAAFNPDFLWKIVLALQSKNKLQIRYTRLKENKTVSRLVNPVGILFSEFYFYLLATPSDPSEKEHFDKKNDPFPTIYRIDRIQKLIRTNENYSVDYKNRFKEGEYKNKIQYMYGGETQQITFKYTGASIDAVLDKLPLSKVIQNKDGAYTVTAEVFGTGIKMWLLSQGHHVQVLSPQSLVDEISKEISKMNALYVKPSM